MLSKGVSSASSMRETCWAPLLPTVASGPMDLLHLNFTKVEVTGDSKKELQLEKRFI